ncbi:MAG: hypothetical protein RSB35_02455 [Eubacterium sp.]
MASTGTEVMDRILLELEDRRNWFERAIAVAVRDGDYASALAREARLKETRHLIAYIDGDLREELEV